MAVAPAVRRRGQTGHHADAQRARRQWRPTICGRRGTRRRLPLQSGFTAGRILRICHPSAPLARGAGKSSVVRGPYPGGPPARGRSGTKPRTAAPGVGWPEGVAPPAPADPGVTISRHRALVILTTRTVRPCPVGEEPGVLAGEALPAGRGLPHRAQPFVFLADPPHQVGVDAG
jgi:hypothetical protein